MTIAKQAPARRRGLEELDGRLFLTDGGIETTLIFHRGLELPEFAAFDLLRDEAGADELRRYYEPYLELAAARGLGFVLEAPTWRANPDWASKLGYSPAALARANRRAVTLMEELRSRYESPATPVLISGCIGPQGDGYSPETTLTAPAAEAYHRAQVEVFADCRVDLVTAITMTYADEPIGVVRAAAKAGVPSVISFTVETDGRLPSGQPLADAIEQVDGETDGGPAYYMLNCAHPTHFAGELAPGERWAQRIRGLRANASAKSHAELDESTELDEGDPDDLAQRYVALRERLPRLTVLGGCCGTDHRHVGAVCAAWLATG